MQLQVENRLPKQHSLLQTSISSTCNKYFFLNDYQADRKIISYTLFQLDYQFGFICFDIVNHYPTDSNQFVLCYGSESNIPCLSCDVPLRTLLGFFSECLNSSCILMKVTLAIQVKIFRNALGTLRICHYQ